MINPCLMEHGMSRTSSVRSGPSSVEVSCFCICLLWEKAFNAARRRATGSLIIEGFHGGSQTISTAASSTASMPSKAHWTPWAMLSPMGQPGW